MRWHVVFREDRRDGVGQRALEQVASRDVHGCVYVGDAGLAERGQKVDCVADHEFAELRATALFFDDRDELAGHHHRSIGLWPAGEQLETDRSTRAQVGDRLTERNDVVFIEGVGEPLRQRQAIGLPFPQAGTHVDQLVLPGGLRDPECSPCLAEQFGGVGAGPRKRRADDAHGQVECRDRPVVVDEDRECGQFSEVGRLGSDGDELVSAESGDRPAFGQPRLDVLRNLAQDVITGRVTVGVVQLFEIVDVEEDADDLVVDEIVDRHRRGSPRADAGEVVDEAAHLALDPAIDQ